MSNDLLAKAFGVETRLPLFSLEREWNNKTEFRDRDLNRMDLKACLR